MKFFTFSTALVVLTFGGVLGDAMAGPGAAGPFEGRRVILFGLDGVRSDALKVLVESGRAPHMAQLIEEGAVNWSAVAGGWTPDPADPTREPTFSGPGWASTLTGVWANKHGVRSNNFSGSNFDDYPHFFKRIREAAPDADLSSLVSWPEINNFIVVRSGGEAICDIYNFTSGSYHQRDGVLTEKTIELLEEGDPDVIFHYQAAPDGAGHAHRFALDSPQYMASIEVADERIGLVLEAVRARPGYADEDWLYIVMSDHGGIGTSHGGHTPEERTIPFIVTGGAVPKGVENHERTGLVTVPPTIFRHLGIPINAAWEWEDDAFELAPRLRADSGARSVFLTWNPPPGGFAGLTGYELRRDGVVAATLGPEVDRWTDESPGDPEEASVEYELVPLGSMEASLTVTAKMPGYVAPPPPPLELEVYLPLDGGLGGAAGTTVNGTAIGTNAASPTFVAGKFGQATAFANTNGNTTTPNDWAVSLGNLDPLYDQSFSLSLWVRWTGTPLASVDKAIIGNSNWASGNNTGWLISSLGAGREGKLKTTTGSRHNQQIRWNDGNWNHVVLTVDRQTHIAHWYLNGNVLNPNGTQIGAATMAAGLPTLIGGSGNGTYSANTTEIDDVAIFSGVMAPHVVGYLYHGGTGRTADQFADAPPPGEGLSIFHEWMDGHVMADPSFSGDDLLPLADPDGNGLPNLLEFAIGGHPFRAAPRPPGLEIFRNEAGELRVMFPQRSGGGGVHGLDSAYHADGLAYRLLAAGSPEGPWLETTGAVVQRDEESFGEGGWHRVVLEVPPAQTSGFFRLEVSSSD